LVLHQASAKLSIVLMAMLLLTTAGAARDYTQDYNNFLTRSVADYIYCMQTGSCRLDVLIVNNLTILNFINATVIEFNVTGNMVVHGNLTVTEGTTTTNLTIPFGNGYPSVYMGDGRLSFYDMAGDTFHFNHGIYIDGGVNDFLDIGDKLLVHNYIRSDTYIVAPYVNATTDLTFGSGLCNMSGNCLTFDQLNKSNSSEFVRNNTENNYFILANTINASRNITITDEGYFSGQPITGMLGSGIIWANGTNNFAEVNVTCVGLTCTWNAFTVRLVKTDNSVKYCNISAGSRVVTDNQHDVLYIDNNCNIAETSIQTFITTQLSPGGIADFGNIVAYQGGTENRNGIAIENKRMIKLRKLLLRTIHLDILTGFQYQLTENFPNLTITNGEYVYLMDVVPTGFLNITSQGIEQVSHETALTWRHKDSTVGINFSWCDTGVATALCTNPTRYRRIFLFDIGNNDSTIDTSRLHQLLPLESVNYANIADCMNTIANPLTYTIPSYYQYSAVFLWAYCGKATDTAWTTNFIDLRTVKQSTSTGGIDTSIFVPYSGASSNINIEGYNLTSSDTLISRLLNVSNATIRLLNTTNLYVSNFTSTSLFSASNITTVNLNVTGQLANISNLNTTDLLMANRSRVNNFIAYVNITTANLTVTSRIMTANITSQNSSSYVYNATIIKTDGSNNVTFQNNATVTSWGTCMCIGANGLWLCSNQSSTDSRKGDAFMGTVSNQTYMYSQGLCK
jgi:hypothetical protein